MNIGLFQMNKEEIILRDYQKEAISEARSSIAKNHKIIVQLATGSGKTIIATKMIKDAVKKGYRCAFVCDRLSLINQASQVFGRFGVNHGIIQADHPLYDPLNSVQVCSIQTLARRKYKKFDFVIIDECHSFFKAHKKLCEETKYVIGLSATPWRNGLGKYFNDLINPVGVRELIDNGYLVDFDVYSTNKIDTKGLKTRAGEFLPEEIADRADKAKITGDIVEHWERLADGRKTICFCTNIAHAKHVSREFNRKGIESVQINSFQKSDDERKIVMDSFCHGTAKVICSVDILGKGFDYPQVDCVILARPTKSPTVHVQQVGRGLRNYENAPRCLILDHAGNTERLGFVDDMPFIPLNENKQGKSGNKKKTEVKEKKPEPCKSCDFLKPAGVVKCPSCGVIAEHIENIDVEEGELKKLKREKYSLIEKQMFLGGLNTYAKSKGMSQHQKGFYGWAIHQYVDKFGCQPSSKISWSYQCGISKDVKKWITHINIKYIASKKYKKPQPCRKCGGVKFVEKPHYSKTHKRAIYCSSCDTFNKFGELPKGA